MDRLPVRAVRNSADPLKCGRGVRPLRPQAADYLGPRHDDHVVRRPVHARQRAGPTKGRSRPYRHPLGSLLGPNQRHDR